MHGLITSNMVYVIGCIHSLAAFMTVIGRETFSAVIANIPLVAAMLPTVDFLSLKISAANSKVLYYALLMGAVMGGNETLIGGEANLVTYGITNQTDKPISSANSMIIGLSVTYIILLIGSLRILIHF